MSDNPNFIKNGGKGTKVGNFLRSIKKNILPSVLEAVGVGDLAKAAGIISNDVNNAGLSKEEAEKFFKLYELDMKDRVSARIMQTEISKSSNTGWFAKNYLYMLSTLIIIAAISFGLGLMFYEIPESNKRMVEMFADIFLFSGAVTILNFFYGSSKGSKDKTEKMRI